MEKSFLYKWRGWSADSKALGEAEGNELIDAKLPGDEMHGITNVVAAAKGGEE